MGANLRSIHRQFIVHEGSGSARARARPRSTRYLAELTMAKAAQALSRRPSALPWAQPSVPEANLKPPGCPPTNPHAAAPLTWRVDIRSPSAAYAVSVQLCPRPLLPFPPSPSRRRARRRACTHECRARVMGRRVPTVPSPPMLDRNVGVGAVRGASMSVRRC